MIRLARFPRWSVCFATTQLVLAGCVSSDEIAAPPYRPAFVNGAAASNIAVVTSTTGPNVSILRNQPGGPA